MLVTVELSHLGTHLTLQNEPYRVLSGKPTPRRLRSGWEWGTNINKGGGDRVGCNEFRQSYSVWLGLFAFRSSQN